MPSIKDSFELVQRFVAGESSAEATINAALKLVDAREPQVGAFLHLDRAGALAQARALDARRKRGEKLGKLAAVPVAIKDNIHVAGQQTTCASHILEGFKAPYDATVTARLKAADAIILGKTNLDEFAMGSSCENSALKQTRNPFDLSRVPGGSSGGSAAAVAARMALIALGSDTGGSIREPASFCGVVGLKPSYGRVSRFGLVAFASSLDQVGPFSLTVRDAALSLHVMAGHDSHDATSSTEPVPDYCAALRTDCQGLRVGVVKSYFDDCPNRDVAQKCWQAVQRMQSLGAELVEIELPRARDGLAVYYVVASAEASSNLSRFDGVRFGLREKTPSAIQNYFATRGHGFGPEVKRRIMLGTHALSAGAYEEFYGRASKVRTLIVNDFKAAFARCDVIASPTAPFTAFKAGEKSDPLSMYLCDIYTIPANLAGLCALSMPVGTDQQGLPVGLQLQCAPYAENTLFGAASALESDLSLELAPTF